MVVESQEIRQPAPLEWQAPPSFLHEAGFGRDPHGPLAPSSYPITSLDALPFARTRAPFERPYRVISPDFTFTPTPDTSPMRFPIAGLAVLLAPAAISSYAFGRRYGVAGAVGGALGGLAYTGEIIACVSPQTVEVAPAPSTESVKAELTPWLGHEMNGYTLTGFPSYYDKPSQLLHPQLTSQEPLSGYYTIAIAEGKSSSGALKSYNFLVALDAQGNATDSYYIHYTPQTEAVGLVTNAELLDKSDKKIADFYFNADFTDQSAPMATVKFLEPTPVPNSGAPVNLVELKFSDGASTEEKQNMMDTLMSHTLTGNVLAAGEGTLVSPSATPTSTEAPTAVPTPTENPLAGAPEGATGKNSKGEWIREVTDEMGKTHIYTWTELTSEVSGWFESHGEDVTLFRHEDDPYGASDMIPMDVYFQEDVSGPYINEVTRQGSTSTTSLTGVLSQQIGERFALDHNKKLSADIWTEIRDQMENGSLKISYTTPDGLHSFDPSKTKGYKVYFVDWEIADPAKNSDYWEFGSNWRLMTTGKDGEVIFILSSKNPLENVGKTEFAQMLFLGLARVIDNPDQSVDYFKQHQAASNKMWTFADWAINQSLPTIDINSTP